MGAIIGPPGEAMEKLDSPYLRCAGRADRGRKGAVVALQMRRVTYAQGRSRRKSSIRRLTILDFQPASPLGDSPFRNYTAKSANFGPFLYLALLLTTISYFEGVGEVLRRRPEEKRSKSPDRKPRPSTIEVPDIMVYIRADGTIGTTSYRKAKATLVSKLITPKCGAAILAVA
ncbi:hypothetical protein THAOC_02586, partial [Thalassiosira oceanica]